MGDIMKTDENSNTILKIIGKNIAKYRRKKTYIVKEKSKVGRFDEEDTREVEKKYTQKMLADKLGTSERTVKRIENGETKKLDIETLLNISDILEINFCYLLEDTHYFTYKAPSQNEMKLQGIENYDLRNLIEKIIHNLYCYSHKHNSWGKINVPKELSDNEKILLIKTFAKFL